MTPLKGEAKGASHKAGGEGFAACCKQLVEGLVQSFRRGTVVVHPKKPTFVEEISDLCVAPGMEDRAGDHPAGPTGWDHGGNWM